MAAESSETQGEGESSETQGEAFPETFEGSSDESNQRSSTSSQDSSAKNQKPLDERQLIDSIKEWTGGKFIGDDCAVLPGGLLVSSDSLVEGTHFIRDWTTFQMLGWKSCAVNLSDIAAMAGRASYLTLSLTVPPGMERSSFRHFYRGFQECARAYRSEIVGGDLTSGPVFVVAVTVLGRTHENGCLRRSGALEGDAVVVTGDFGSSGAGLLGLRKMKLADAQKRFPHCIAKHLQPKPRLCESWSLVRRTGSRGALMDASDGLADALVQISRASQIGMDIDFDAVPVHEETRRLVQELGGDLNELVLYGGEDYELVGTLAEDVWAAWDKNDDNPFVRIGTVKSGKDVSLKSSGANVPRLDLSKCFQQIGLS